MFHPERCLYVCVSSGPRFGSNAAFIYSCAADKSSVEIKCGSESPQASALVSSVYSPSEQSVFSRLRAQKVCVGLISAGVLLEDGVFKSRFVLFK